jgi:hypothetical protein
MPEFLNEVVAAQPPLARALWAIVSLALLVAALAVLRLERRMFVARGKGASWWVVRLASLPALAVVVAAVFGPERAVSGMEGLAVFYLLLLVAAPLLWFGVHLLAGWLASPRMSRGESAWIAGSGLMLLLCPLAVFTALQTPVFMISSQFDAAARAARPDMPLPHRADAAQRFRLGDAGVLVAQSLIAPPGVRIERVEALQGGLWADTATQMHPWLCRNGEDLHLAWADGSEPPLLRIFWRDTAGKAWQSGVKAAPAALPTLDFVVAWRDDGFDLPVPLSRDRVQPGWLADGRPHYRSLNGSLQPGENARDDCVMRGYRRVARDVEGPVVAVLLRIERMPPAGTMEYLLVRR